MISDDSFFDSQQANRDQSVASWAVVSPPLSLPAGHRDVFLSEVREEGADTRGVNRKNYHSSLELTRTVRDRALQHFDHFLLALSDAKAGVMSLEHTKRTLSKLLESHPDLMMEIGLFMPGGTLRVDLVEEKKMRDNIDEVFFAHASTCLHIRIM